MPSPPVPRPPSVWRLTNHNLAATAAVAAAFAAGVGDSVGRRHARGDDLRVWSARRQGRPEELDDHRDRCHGCRARHLERLAVLAQR